MVEELLIVVRIVAQSIVCNDNILILELVPLLFRMWTVFLLWISITVTFNIDMKIYSVFTFLFHIPFDFLLNPF